MRVIPLWHFLINKTLHYVNTRETLRRQNNCYLPYFEHYVSRTQLSVYILKEYKIERKITYGHSQPGKTEWPMGNHFQLSSQEFNFETNQTRQKTFLHVPIL